MGFRPLLHGRFAQRGRTFHPTLSQRIPQRVRQPRCGSLQPPSPKERRHLYVCHHRQRPSALYQRVATCREPHRSRQTNGHRIGRRGSAAHRTPLSADRGGKGEHHHGLSFAAVAGGIVGASLTGVASVGAHVGRAAIQTALCARGTQSSLSTLSFFCHTAAQRTVAGARQLLPGGGTTGNRRRTCRGFYAARRYARNALCLALALDAELAETHRAQCPPRSRPAVARVGLQTLHPAQPPLQPHSNGRLNDRHHYAATAHRATRSEHHHRLPR